MPAYFSIYISIKKADRYDGIFADFVELLKKEGLSFMSGYAEFMDEPLEDIITWNEKKLQEDFKLGYKEHYSSDYRQVYFDYQNFSEVRMLILNERSDSDCGQENDSEEAGDATGDNKSTGGAFIFEIIIPEDELLQVEDGRFTYNPQIMDDIKQLILNIWKWPYVSAIQTSLELSGDIMSLKDLENGKKPSIVPLAVIPEEFMNYDLGDKVTSTHVGRNGLLLEDY